MYATMKQVLLLGSLLAVASAAPTDAAPAGQDNNTAAPANAPAAQTSNPDAWLNTGAQVECPSQEGEKNSGELYLTLTSKPQQWPGNTPCSLAFNFPWTANFCECHRVNGLFINDIWCDASIVNHNANQGEPTEITMKWWGSYLFSSKHTKMYLQDGTNEYSCEPNCSGVKLNGIAVDP